MNLISRIRSAIHNAFGRTSMGQNGFRNLTNVAPSVNGEVFQNLKIVENDTVFTADYVNVTSKTSDASVSLTLDKGDVLPGAWHNVIITSGKIVAYF